MEQYIAQQILKVRDALVNKDCDEAYHQLYAIASKGFDKWEPWEEIEKAATQPPSAPEEIISKAKQLFSRISKYSQPGTIDHLATIRRLSQQGIDLFEQPTPAPAVNWDQVKINFDAGMSELEASFQAGYSAGVDMAVKRAASAPDVEISKTIDRLKECISRHMDPYNLGDEGETTKLIHQLIKHVQAASTTQGAVWVKASIQLPKVDKEILFVKYDNGNTICNLACLYQHGVFHSAQWGVLPIERVEYLDETGYYKSSYIQEYKQMKEYEKFLGGPDEWTEEKIKSMNRIEILEALKGYHELIQFLDNTIYAIEEGSKQWEERALKAETGSQRQQSEMVWVKANELKIALYDHLLQNSTTIDEPYLHTKGKTYSRKELANELMAETPVAIDMICNLLMLSIEKFRPVSQSTSSKESDAVE